MLSQFTRGDLVTRMHAVLPASLWPPVHRAHCSLWHVTLQESERCSRRQKTDRQTGGQPAPVYTRQCTAQDATRSTDSAWVQNPLHGAHTCQPRCSKACVHVLADHQQPFRLAGPLNNNSNLHCYKFKYISHHNSRAVHSSLQDNPHRHARARTHTHTHTHTHTPQHPHSYENLSRHTNTTNTHSPVLLRHPKPLDCLLPQDPSKVAAAGAYQHTPQPTMASTQRPSPPASTHQRRTQAENTEPGAAGQTAPHTLVVLAVRNAD
jgi:hypothetical protein